MTILDMSLKINNWKKIILGVVWLIVAGIFIASFIRVATFEAKYYSEKEGSERVVIEETAHAPEVDETEITEEQVVEYTVAYDRPRYLTIEKLGIKNARILAVGLTTNGELGTPNNIFDAGWYDASGKPGQGGTLLLDGHNGGPTKIGIFKYLPSLDKGDKIIVERGDGTIFNYEVVENTTVSLDEADGYMAVALRTPIAGKESLSIITCTGEWSQERSTYLSRQFTRAILIEE